MFNVVKVISISVIVVLGILSCGKEKSFELPGNSSPSMGDDCIIMTVVPTDVVSGNGLGSYNITLNTNRLTTGLQLYDSITQTLHFSTQFVYSGDTIRLGSGEYFVTDGSGRIIEFYTHAVPGDFTSEEYIYRYFYDDKGFLASKNRYRVAYSTIEPIFIYTYTWQDQNLIKVTANEAGGDKRIALSADIVYNNAVKPKNFIYVFPEADELAPYVFSVYVGNKSASLPTHITVKLYDENGAVSDTYNTVYSSHKLSPEGYVLELFASGDNVDGLLLISEGLIKFKYTCD